MTLTAYWLGQNIVAAASPEAAVLVMERHEPPGKWQLGDVRPLTAAELAAPVDSAAPGTVAEELERCMDAAGRSRLAVTLTQGQGRLIRWDYPSEP